MRVLVVIAHPLLDSLCAELARVSIEELRSAGHELRVEDLYSNGFSPALQPHERQDYYKAFPREGVASEIANLEWAQGLVLVFPTWWFGFPAMLKGWFDRVWAPGIAYDHAADLGSLRPRLHELRQALAITSLGSPWWIDTFVFRKPVRRILKTGILGPCAPACHLDFLSIYRAERLQPAQVEMARNRVKAAVKKAFRSVI